MFIKEILSPGELEKCFHILRELRSALNYSEFLAIFESARNRDEYKLVGFFDGEKCLAVMGYRILYDFVHGKHLYIDDLVVAAGSRSRGLGKELLEFAEKEAEVLGCQGLRLCAGIENEGGRRFYERLGWKARALAYKKKIGSRQ